MAEYLTSINIKHDNCQQFENSKKIIVYHLKERLIPIIFIEFGPVFSNIFKYAIKNFLKQKSPRQSPV
jgi:hypothetical protein